jgi:hypothetical protein
MSIECITIENITSHQIYWQISDLVGTHCLALSIVVRILGSRIRFSRTHEAAKPGTHYPHVTWAHVMLRVKLGYLTLNSGAHSRFCHSAYVTWSDLELWSAHMPARLSNFCSRTHFVRHDVRHVSRNVCDNRNLRGVLARETTRAPRQITWRKQSDRSVSVRQNSVLNMPTALVTSQIGRASCRERVW